MAGTLELSALGGVKPSMYGQYFGFRSDPFSVAPDPNVFYENPMYREALAALTWSVQARKGIVCLIGEVGTGKTTLLRRLVAQLEPGVRPVVVPHPASSFEELLRVVCAELGLPIPDGGWLERIGVLTMFLTEQAAGGGTVALLLDEAQHLGDGVFEQLRLLSNLERPGQKLLQILLVGQPELATRLEQPQLRPVKQRIALQCRLGALRYREIGPYIRYRLAAAGYEGPPLFTPEAIQEIAFYSSGVPRVINIICDNALLAAYTSRRRTVSTDIIQEVAHQLRLGPTVVGIRPRGPDTPAAPPGPGDLAPDSPGELARVRPATEPRDQAPPGWVKPRIRSVRPPRKARRSWLRVALLVTLAIAAVGGSIVLPAPLFTLPEASIPPGVTRLMDLLAHLAGRTGVTAERPPGAATGDRTDSLAQVDRAAQPSAPAIGEPPRPAAAPAAGPDPEATRSLVTSAAPSADGVRVREPLATPVKPGPPARSMVIERGSTISEIAGRVYGQHSLLLYDLLKEFNPNIENLNRVLAGQRLTLPAFTRDTLLRQQPDGSYHLIVGSFEAPLEAQRLAEAAQMHGYRAVVSSRRVADDLVVYRVELAGLPDERAASRAWETAVARAWLPSTP